VKLKSRWIDEKVVYLRDINEDEGGNSVKMGVKIA
jgi:hypothetical protein